MTDLWQQGYEAYWNGESLNPEWPDVQQDGWCEAEYQDCKDVDEEPPLGWYEDDYFDNYPFAGENR